MWSITPPDIYVSTCSQHVTPWESWWACTTSTCSTKKAGTPFESYFIPKKETLAFSHSIIEKATFGFSLIPPILNTTCSLSLVDFNFTHTHMHAHTHTPYAFNYYYSLFINIKAWVKLSFWHCPPMPLKSISFAHID